jgi:hypothetical protein
MRFASAVAPTCAIGDVQYYKCRSLQSASNSMVLALVKQKPLLGDPYVDPSAVRNSFDTICLIKSS